MNFVVRNSIFIVMLCSINAVYAIEDHNEVHNFYKEELDGKEQKPSGVAAMYTAVVNAWQTLKSLAPKNKEVVVQQEESETVINNKTETIQNTTISKSDSSNGTFFGYFNDVVMNVWSKEGLYVLESLAVVATLYGIYMVYKKGYFGRKELTKHIQDIKKHPYYVAAALAFSIASFTGLVSYWVKNKQHIPL